MPSRHVRDRPCRQRRLICPTTSPSSALRAAEADLDGLLVLLGRAGGVFTASATLCLAQLLGQCFWGHWRWSDRRSFSENLAAVSRAGARFGVIRTKTLGAVPRTEQAVWGVGSAGKPRAPTQEPAHRICLRLQLFSVFHIDNVVRTKKNHHHHHHP